MIHYLRRYRDALRCSINYGWGSQRTDPASSVKAEWPSPIEAGELNDASIMMYLLSSSAEVRLVFSSICPACKHYMRSRAGKITLVNFYAAESSSDTDSGVVVLVVSGT